MGIELECVLATADQGRYAMTKAAFDRETIAYIISHEGTLRSARANSDEVDDATRAAPPA